MLGDEEQEDEIKRDIRDRAMARTPYRIRAPTSNSALREKQLVGRLAAPSDRMPSNRRIKNVLHR